MSALVAGRRTETVRPSRTVLDHVRRSLTVLYWSAGLLLIVPLGLVFWALSATVRKVWQLAHPPQPERSLPPKT